MGFYNKKPVAIGELIKTYIEKYPRKKELKRGMVLSLLPKIAGKRVHEQISNAWFKDDKLCLKVKDQAWRQEIHMQRYSLMQKLNHEVREQIVSEIIVF
jgi:hypothetical protein